MTSQTLREKKRAEMHDEPAAQVEASARGLLLSGDLVFATVQPLLEQCERILADHRPRSVDIDCSASGRMDSAGIALLMEIKRWCYRHEKFCSILNLPEQAQALLDATRADSVLFDS